MLVRRKWLLSVGKLVIPSDMYVDTQPIDQQIALQSDFAKQELEQLATSG